MFETFEQFDTFLNKIKPTDYTIQRFRTYLDAKGNEHLQLKCIHVGGTNGKGSTSNYIRSILTECGYRVASFNSPAFDCRNDIVCIDGKAISKEAMLHYANARIDGFIQYGLSSFEIEVAIAFEYFLDQDVDFVVLEVGLGGVDDATNVVMPLVSVITNIGLDHVDFLGNTVEEIATVKAGIIKENVDVITSEQKQGCLDILKKRSALCNCDCYVMDYACDYKVLDNKIYYTYFGLDICLNTMAHYQVMNSRLAMYVIHYLRDKGLIDVFDDAIKKGVFNAKWMMRYEIIHQNPLIILDGAHNIDGISSFVQSSEKFRGAKIIFGAFKDKDIKKMYELLQSLSHDITVCSFDHPRSASLKDYCNFGIVCTGKSFDKIMDQSMDKDNIILVTGSLSFVSMVRQYVLQKKGESTF